MSLALAIGKFDALHTAHRALIVRAAGCGEPVLVHFSGMAAELGWDQRLPLLGVLERTQILQQWSSELGKQISEIAIPFAAVRHLSPRAFIEYISARYSLSAIVTGDNFRFGYQRSGSLNDLRDLGREFDFQVETVAGISDENALISSSRIRAAVTVGDCVLARRLLGRPYALQGTVVRGDQRGRSIGFPTANVQGIDSLIPATGVYAGFASIAGAVGLIPAAINIGYLPSISAQRDLSVEAHLLDWSGDCYDQHLKIVLCQRVRDEQRFASLEQLQAHITTDVDQARQILSVDKLWQA